MNKDNKKSVIAIIVGILAICALVMWIYRALTPDASPGDLLSLGQLCVEAALIPIAVFGFWYAALEFNKSQRRPKLYLAWDDEVLVHNKELTLYIERPNMSSAKTPERISRSIALHNEGDNVATWFSVHLAFPVELLGRQNVPHYWSPEL